MRGSARTRGEKSPPRLEPRPEFSQGGPRPGEHTVLISHRSAKCKINYVVGRCPVHSEFQRDTVVASQTPEPLEFVARRAVLVAPTMAGFTWLEPSNTLPPGQGGDAWCVRDSMCELFGWPVGGWEWRAFIQGPGPGDVQRLEDHLGLVHVVHHSSDDMAWFERNRAHPGIIAWNLLSDRWTHFDFARDLRAPAQLPVQYLVRRPSLAGYLVDVRQAPHAPVVP